MEPLITDIEWEKDLDKLIDSEISKDYSLIQQIFRNSAINLIVFDLNGRIEFASESFCNMFGYDEKKIDKKLISDLIPNLYVNGELSELLEGTGVNSDIRGVYNSIGQKINSLVYTSVLKEYGSTHFLAIIVRSELETI